MLIVFYCKIMPSFFIWNHCKNNFIFTIWAMFWNIGSICYSLQIFAYWKHLLSFLLMGFIAACFLSNQENLYMIHHDLVIFYDIYNATNEHNWGQTHDIPLIPNYFELIKKSFYNFICFIINDDFCYHFLNTLHALHHYL